MTFANLLATTIHLLDAARVPFMITGSIASSFHGEPRATRDLDVVIDPTPAELDALIRGLQAAGFYVDRDAAKGALQARTQFNAIGPDAMKVDFIVRKDRPFSSEEFARRQQVSLLGTPAFMATPEDLILAKLEWAAATDSERQLRDVAGMLEIAGDTLDRTYLGHWLTELGLTRVWERLGSVGARPPDPGGPS